MSFAEFDELIASTEKNLLLLGKDRDEANVIISDWLAEIGW